MTVGDEVAAGAAHAARGAIRMFGGSGAIAPGHPIGCSAASRATRAVRELHRRGRRPALVTPGIGGGQGIAAIFERL